jgi:prepilin-type N-terminal cleavage/methylation domain-containing protein
MPTSSNRPAFTLLELIVVLSVLGIVMAIAAPGVSRSRNAAAVRSASNDLASTFAFARQAALSRRRLTAIVFDTAAGVVTVRSAGAGAAERILWRDLGLSYGIVLRANRDSAVYDARGLGYGVSNLTITIRRGTAVDTLTLSRLGRLR